MHIPDGFINGLTSVGAGVVAAGGLGTALRRAGRTLKDRFVPLAGLVAAFIFSMQMVNFPVGAGTSGHLIGGSLAAVLLGPWVAVVVMSVVVIVQALLFADGGVSALGLNLLNLALLTVAVGWWSFRAARAALPATTRWVIGSAGLAGSLSTIAASLGFVAEYSIGGTGGVPARTVLVAMTGVHTLIGISEGLITGAVVAAVLATRPDLVFGARDLTVARRGRARVGAFVAAGLGVALLVAALLSPLASSSPDGLERVAIDQGFAEQSQPSTGAPLADYGEASGVGTAGAGVAGVVATFGIGAGILALRRRRRTRAAGS